MRFFRFERYQPCAVFHLVADDLLPYRRRPYLVKSLFLDGVYSRFIITVYNVMALLFFTHIRLCHKQYNPYCGCSGVVVSTIEVVTERLRVRLTLGKQR